MRAFADRIDAGQQLAAKLSAYRARANALVLALPRGGVPVAAEVAGALHLPLDVLVVRKLGAPDQPELAMGAIASGGAVVMNPEVSAYFANRPNAVAAVTQREQQELARRERTYRGAHAPLDVASKTVVVVDDGAATGATMRAAVQTLRALGVAHIVVALPVCSRDAAEVFEREADEFVCLSIPDDFYAVGQWYRHFDQISDTQVQALLSKYAAS